MSSMQYIMHMMAHAGRRTCWHTTSDDRQSKVQACRVGCNPGDCTHAQPSVVPAGAFPAGSGPDLLVGLCCSIPVQLRYAATHQHPCITETQHRVSRVACTCTYINLQTRHAGLTHRTIIHVCFTAKSELYVFVLD